MDKRRHIVVVGAGPGGLTAAMLLSRRGFRVTLLEKKAHVGGRNAPIRLGGFTFDTGPTFLMLKHILDEVFEESGHRSTDFMEFARLDPMYRLVFEDFSIEMSGDHGKMREQIARHFPGQERGLDRYYESERMRYERVYPCLQKDYSSPVQMVNPALVKAVPRLSLGRTLFGVLGDYFTDERLRLAFTFQAKYLGMSPWHCPGAFAILSYVEHAYGVWHVKGGLSVISDSMAKAAQANGAELRLGSPVKSLLLDGRKARGVILESGERIPADEVVIGADFGHAMGTLVPPGVLRKYSPERLAKKKLSCSTFMLYLGLDHVPDLPHHTIVFARDYRANTENIFLRGGLTDDMSLYVRNASVTDPTLAPAGKSALYVLVPVPNRNAPIDWPREGEGFRSLVFRRMGEKLGLSGLEGHIEQERVVTPADWEDEWAVYRGATFNLAHSLDQMLYLRPRNRFEELDNTWLVGGGTHPGSGLPTIYESGRITANMISGKYGVEFRGQTPLADVRQ